MRSTAIIGIMIAAAIAGCTTSVTEEAKKRATTVDADASRRIASAALPLPPADLSHVKVRDGVYMGAVARAIEYGDPLPTSVEGRDGISVAYSEPMTLREIAVAVTKASGIPVVVAPKPEYVKEDEEDETGLSEEGLQEALAAVGGGSMQGQDVIRAARSTPTSMLVSYSGSLSGLLDLISAHFNVDWRHDAGRITLAWTETRTFSIPALPAATNMGFTMKSEGGTTAESETAQAGLSSTSSIEMNVWQDIRDGLEGIIVDDGSFSASVGTGTVTVTASPSVMKRVKNYLTAVNSKLSKQVAVSVQVLSVTLSEEDSYNFDLGVLFNGSSRFGGGFGNVSGAAQQAIAAGTANALMGGGGLGWALVGPDSNWQGTQGIVEALSKEGEVSVVTSASITTLSNVPAPLQVGNVREYVAERNTTSEEGVISTSVVTKEVTTGFNLSLLPSVLDNGGVLLQYGVSMSELVGHDDGFDVFVIDDNGSQVRQANKDLRNFVQQAVIPNGNTLVIAGFERYHTESSKSGTGSPDFWLFGGGRAGKVKREVIVIVITPTVLDMGKALAAN